MYKYDLELEVRTDDQDLTGKYLIKNLEFSYQIPIGYSLRFGDSDYEETNPIKKIISPVKKDKNPILVAEIKVSNRNAFNMLEEILEREYELNSRDRKDPLLKK
jgi:hypothetical protein